MEARVGGDLLKGQGRVIDQPYSRRLGHKWFCHRILSYTGPNFMQRPILGRSRQQWSFCATSPLRAFSDRLESLRDPVGLKKCSSLTMLEQIVRPGVNTPDLTLL
jgi:hypothetical protein